MTRSGASGIRYSEPNPESGYWKGCMGVLLPDDPDKLRILSHNMNLAPKDGTLKPAGVLLCIEHPEWITPVYCKAGKIPR